MAKEKARHVDFYPDEYIAGVAGTLKAEEQGVYWMICALVMSEGGPVANYERRLSTLCSLRPSDVRRIVSGLIEKGKIGTTTDAKVFQNRAQSEVEKVLNRIQKARESGGKGGRPAEKNKQNQQKEEGEGFSEQNLTINHQPSTTNLNEKEEPSGSSKKRAVRLSAVWQCPPEWIDEAVEAGMPRSKAIAEAERMKNWSLSNPKGAKLDWRAAWRNWYTDKLDKPRSTGTTKAELFGRM